MDEKPRVRRWWIGWLGIGTLVLGYLAYTRGWLTPRPRWVAMEPQADEEVWSTTPEVVLRFSAAVDRAQLTQAVQLEPPVTGRWRDDDQGRTWRFVPDAPGWPRGAQVRVVVGPPLSDTPRRLVFRIRPTLLAYLWPHTGPRQVYARDPAGRGHQALTHTRHRVLAFSVAPDGNYLVYSAANDQGGADVWLQPLPDAEAQLLIRCGADVCDEPRVGPGGRIAFVREPQNAPPRVEVWHPATGALVRPTAQGASYGPLWSATGLLAFYGRAEAAYIVWNPVQREAVEHIANDTGEHAAWGPQGRFFYHVVLYDVPPDEPDIPDPRLSAHVLRYDRNTQTTDDLTNAWHWEDATPAADPTGRYLAFGRKHLRPEGWTPGRQLWLYDLKRGGAYPLTDAAAYNHLDFAWSPDGRQLAYVRTHQLDLSAAPELWLYDLETHHHASLLEGAYAPQWLP